MNKCRILLLSIAVLVLALGTTGCNDTGRTDTYTLETLEKGTLHLKVLKQWTGTGENKFYFDVDEGPFVVDFDSERTSSLGASLWIAVGQAYGPIIETNAYCDVVGQRKYAIINKSGHFGVAINSSGCRWGVRVGVEQR